jgi:hypothetical protein
MAAWSEAFEQSSARATGDNVIPTSSSNIVGRTGSLHVCFARAILPLNGVQDEAPDGRRRSQVEVRPTRLGTPEEHQRRSEAANRPHLPMELPLSRRPVERDGDDYKRLKAAMARRLRGADE